jgi:8-oxo-dGTP pyrophosphatase MutT (NUDIX family)
VLSPDDGALLLIHHQKLGLWLQPGGHFEPGDRSLSGAARRELREETGVEAVEELDVLFDLDVHAIPARGSVPGHLHFDVRVLLRAETWELAPSQEVRGARWVGLDELAAPDAALSDGSVWRVAAALRDGRPGAARG